MTGFAGLLAVIAALMVWAGLAKLYINNEIYKKRVELAEKFSLLNNSLREKFNSELAIKESLLEERRIQIENFASKLEDEISGKRKELDNIENNLDKQSRLIKSEIAAFESGFLNGRRWLCEMISEYEFQYYGKTEKFLRNKLRPALKSAEEIAIIRKELKKSRAKEKFLEYQLKSLYELFPILGDYEEELLNEEVTIDLQGDNEGDEAKNFMSKEEYDNLSSSERNQLALDRWISRKKSSTEAGRMYERYIGYLYESSGWEVEYTGAINGLEDMGRDLICKNGSETLIIQAKRWAAHKMIHEKHILQTFATKVLYEIENNLPQNSCQAIIFSTTEFSDTAKMAALRLGVKAEILQFDEKYPMIKCKSNGDSKIYHLPFDQQYDKIKLSKNRNSWYIATTAEAESLGFRRAKKHIFNQSST